MRSEQLCGDGLVDEMLRLRGAAERPGEHQLCWYHPGLWTRQPDTVVSSPRFVTGCMAYRSRLRPGRHTRVRLGE